VHNIADRKRMFLRLLPLSAGSCTYFGLLLVASLCTSSDDRVSEGAEEAAQSALPPADLQAAGGGDERPRTRLPADESLQADDQGEDRVTGQVTAASDNWQLIFVVLTSRSNYTALTKRLFTSVLTSTLADPITSGQS